MTNIKPQLIINNERVIKRSVMANKFNKCFVALVSKLNEIQHLNHIILEILCLQGICKTIIPEIKNVKASDIFISVIRKTSDIISPILTDHSDYVMKIGKFTDTLKLGKMTPIYKKEVNNHSKIIALYQFYQYLAKSSRLHNVFVSQSILHEKQFGFERITPPTMNRPKSKSWPKPKLKPKFNLNGRSRS